jgi:hypothetical protein
MTFATFPRELFAIPELRFDRLSTLFTDESNVVVTNDSSSLEGSERALATARKIFHIAKSRYGWSDLEIEDLLCKYHQDSSLDGLDLTAKTIILAETNYNLSRLAEESKEFSFWLNLSPNQREVIFSYASQLNDNLQESSHLQSPRLLDLFRGYVLSFLLNIDFNRLYLDSQDICKKIVCNADLMAEIFEKREGNQPRALNFSKMTQAQRDAAIENYHNIRQVRIDRLTPEELEQSNKQFERTFKQLDESRN